jgi:hypothetical protein
MDKMIQKALSLDSETDDVEFKREFDISSTEHWCEIVKDIISIANSGGGVIVFGLNNQGKPSKEDNSNLEKLDPAHIVDKISKYTDTSFSDFELSTTEKDDEQIYILRIFRSNIPIIFTKPGNYPVTKNRQKTAFSMGTLYFRHGAKSEPGNQSDIRNSIQLEIESIRDSWLSNIRKVIEAPVGSQAILLPPGDFDEEEYTPIPIRVVTDDPDAPQYLKIDPDTSHPYRFTDVIDEVNNQIEDYEINQYDLCAVNAAHSTKEIDSFCHNPKFGSTQYSTAYIQWIINQYKNDKEFFEKAKKVFYIIRYGDQQKNDT